MSGAELAAQGEPVIPAGQEELLAAMVGKDATLPEQCKLTAAGVDHSFVKATYSCPGGEVVFELLHPRKAPAQATQTARFAITLRSGSPPAGLQGALESLIRSRETAFEWTFMQPPRPTPPTSTHTSNRSKRVSPAFVALAGAVVLGVAALGWALRRRGSAPPSQLP